MSNSLISIIIPVYNHAHTLERSFDSIVAQSYRPLEVIVVDDGSTDNLQTIIGKIKFKIKDLDFKFVQQKNFGAAAARNHGLQEAKGEYVIFWDADTIARPEMLERLKKQLDEHPEASYAYCRYKFGWKKMKSQEFSAEDLKKYNYIDTTSLIRKADVTVFDESLKRLQDWDLWLTLLEKNKTGVFVPEVLFKKLVRGRSGISSWLPSFIYRLPWKIRSVREYEEARSVVLKKHRL